MKIRKWSDASR